MLISKNISSSWKFIISVTVCEAVGFVSGFLTVSDMTGWFDTLTKPAWNPSPGLFGPVWTILYFLMGVSFWLIWKSYLPDEKKQSAEIWFVIQLVLNFFWSILFFKLHSPIWALADIILMILAVLITIIKFSHISKLAGLILIPYIGWLSFAAALNYSLWAMNQ